MGIELRVCLQSVKNNQYAWFNFPKPKSVIWKLLGMREDDEYIVVDVENFSSIIREDTSIRELNAFAEKLSQIESKYLELVPLWFREYGNLPDFLSEFEESDWIKVKATNDREFGEYFVKEVKFLSVPPEIEEYFDYEAYGREMRISNAPVISEHYYSFK